VLLCFRPFIAHTTSGQMASSRHPGAIQDGGCEGGSWSDYFDLDGTDFVPDGLNLGEGSTRCTARLPTLSLPPPPPPRVSTRYAVSGVCMSYY